jgi:hypothetical protein
MDVRLTEERILVLPDYFNMEIAEARSQARRVDAFGTFARMAGLVGKTRPEEIELVYKERRLQPYWGLACTAVCTYERARRHTLKLPPEVSQVTVGGDIYAAKAQQAQINVMESCRQELRKEAVFDALSGAKGADLTASAKAAAQRVEPEALSTLGDGTVIVPPQTKAPVVIRDLLATLGPKIEADRLVEETVSFEQIDLYYRPVYAFRYRRANKEAVVEVDGVTGEVRLGGSTFEAYLGKMLEPKFLVEVGAETLNLFLPGATLVKVLALKGMEMTVKK